MKASFALANPSWTRLNWLFMPKIFKETQVGNCDIAVVSDEEEGEVVGCVQVVEEVEVIEEPDFSSFVF